jgi:hypothetical protein
MSFSNSRSFLSNPKFLHSSFITRYLGLRTTLARLLQ